VSDEHKYDANKFGENLRDRIHRDAHERMNQRMGGRIGGRSGNLGMLPGIVLVLIGTVILLSHMGIISADRVWRLWPVVLIVAGGVRFIGRQNRVFGGMLIIIGAMFLLSNFGYLHLRWDDLWPILLIGVGASLIWGRLEMPRLPPSTSTGAPNSINEFAMFGGVERRIGMNNFVGGTVTAMFGGVELDFRSAEIEGEEAVVLVEAVFGGIEIVVPEGWMVIYEGQSIFGGYNDETRPPLPDVPGAAPRKRLILRGRAVFGGITVKN
jgi:predicted membrane protein